MLHRVCAVVCLLYVAGCGVVGDALGPVEEPDPILFNAVTALNGTVGQPFSHSFCRPELTGSGALCQSGSTNPTGGQPPYTFQLGSLGGFPPIGLTLGLNGILSGTPSVDGTSTFSVCAVDLARDSICRSVTMTVIGTVTLAGVTFTCPTSAAPLPGWRSCPGTASLNITRTVSSGVVSVFFNYPTDGAFFRGQLQVGSGIAGAVTVPMVNDYVSHCLTSYASTLRVFDGPLSAGTAPLLLSVPLPITATC